MTARLALFLSFNVPVEMWRSQGLFDREKLIYEKLLANGTYQRIYWFTYGANDGAFQSLLAEGIVIVPMPRIFNSLIGKLLYSIVLPVLHARILRECKVVKTNQMAGSWAAVIAAKLYGLPLILRTGFTLSRNAATKRLRKLDRFATLIESIAYRFCTVAVVTDSVQANYISMRYDLSAERVRVVPNYIDVERFRPVPAETERISGRLVYIGRLSEEKNVLNLISAFAGLPYGLDIYGDGTQSSFLKSHARDVKADVQFHGSIPNARVAEVLPRYSVFVLPSLFEGSPKALLEAMACGLACIGTAVDGIRDVIMHAETGWLVNVDAGSIRDGIRAVMDDEPLRQQLSSNARAFLVQNFSLDRVAEVERSIHQKLFFK